MKMVNKGVSQFRKQTLSLLLLLGTLNFTYSQSVALADLSGDWEWQYLQVKGKPLTRLRNFYATGLSVDGDNFIMRFSEASCSGKVIRQNDAMIFQPSESDKFHYHYDDSEVLKIRGDRLYILFRNNVWPFFVNSEERADLVYCYRRRR